MILAALFCYNTTYYITKIAGFTLEKEIYTPYSLLHLKVYGSFDEAKLKTVRAVQLQIDGKEVHYGTVERLETTEKKDRYFLQVTSKGLTAMLLQNQLTPGLHPGMSLDKLMTDFYTLPSKITWEQSSDASNYLYVKENASMWDGVTNLTYKLCQRYPFIRGANEIRMTLPDSYQTYYAGDSVLSAGIVVDESKLYSDYYMADVDGSYGVYHEKDSLAASLQLVRTKQLALDRQYLYDPPQALSYRKKFNQRGVRRRYVELLGAQDLQLGDRLSYKDVLDKAVICRVRIMADQRGIRTRLETYQDSFYP